MYNAVSDVFSLYTCAVTSQPCTSFIPCSEEFSAFVNPKHCTRYANEEAQVPEPQTFGISIGLEEGQIDNGHLSKQTQADRIVEIMISEEFYFSSQNTLAFTTTGQSVEHVGQHKTRKRHSGVVFADGIVCTHLVSIY